MEQLQDGNPTMGAVRLETTRIVIVATIAKSLDFIVWRMGQKDCGLGDSRPR